MKRIMIFCLSLMLGLAANAELMIRNQSLGVDAEVYVVDCEKGVAIVEATSSKNYAGVVKVTIKWAGVSETVEITVEPGKVASKSVDFFNKGYCGHTPVVTNIVRR